MSEAYKGYVHAVSAWADASDDNVQSMIDEMTYLEELEGVTKEKVSDAVDNVIADLVGEAETARNLAATMDAEAMVADGAAIASVFSFGLGMLVFVGAQAARFTESQILTKVSKDLQDGIDKADVSIANQIDPSVEKYVVQYKKNNGIITGLDVIGMSLREVRSATMEVYANARKFYQDQNLELTPERFKKVALSASMFADDTEYKKLCQLLDEYNLSEDDSTKKELLGQILVTMHSPAAQASPELEVISYIGLSYLVNKLRISRNEIEEVATEYGVEIDITWKDAFTGTTTSAKIVGVIGALLSIADIVLQIIDIVSVVSQCDKLIDSLNGDIKDYYTNYFNGVAEVSDEYNDYLTKVGNE